jgi:hypothetical protein
MIEGRLFEARSGRGGDAYRAAERGFGLTFSAIGFVVGIAKLWRSQSLGWLWLAGPDRRRYASAREGPVAAET